MIKQALSCLYLRKPALSCLYLRSLLYKHDNICRLALYLRKYKHDKAGFCRFYHVYICEACFIMFIFAKPALSCLTFAKPALSYLRSLLIYIAKPASHVNHDACFMFKHAIKPSHVILMKHASFIFAKPASQI